MLAKFPEKKVYNLINILGERLSDMIGGSISEWGIIPKEDKSPQNRIVTYHCIDIKSPRRLYIVWKDYPEVEEIIKVERFISLLGRR